MAGAVGSVTTAIFDEWERDALQGEVEVEWHILQDYFIDANRVTPLPS